eukprot:gene325-180_t
MRWYIHGSIASHHPTTGVCWPACCNAGEHTPERNARCTICSNIGEEEQKQTAGSIVFRLIPFEKNHHKKNNAGLPWQVNEAPLRLSFSVPLTNPLLTNASCMCDDVEQD